MMFCLQRSLVFMARKNIIQRQLILAQYCLSYTNQSLALQSKINYGFLYETQHWVEIG